MTGAVSSIPYTFRDRALLDLALTHSSTNASADNERLEFLGDAALDLIVAEELFDRHADLTEGGLTELKSRLVARRTLAVAARELGLEDEARVGRGLSSRTLSRSILANLYEAVLGAIYLDRGLPAARAFVLATLGGALEHVREREERANPKQQFQEHCQKLWGAPPLYRLLETRGEAHARAFLVCARADGQDYPPAWGRTRKEAERWAAYEALLVLEERAWS